MPDSGNYFKSCLQFAIYLSSDDLHCMQLQINNGKTNPKYPQLVLFSNANAAFVSRSAFIPHITRS